MNIDNTAGYKHLSPYLNLIFYPVFSYLLEYEDGTTRHEPIDKTGLYELKVQLPPGVTCTQCILQWKWRAGKTRKHYTILITLAKIVM